jgi:hypothetical protein
VPDLDGVRYPLDRGSLARGQPRGVALAARGPARPAAALRQSLRAGGQVVDHLGHLGADRGRVEHDEVGGEAGAEQPAIGQAPLRGCVEGDHPDRLLERQRLLGAHPVAQEMRLERGVHELGDVRARVREGHDGARVLDQLEGVLLVLVGDGLEEEELEVLLERQVDHCLGRVLTAFARDRCHHIRPGLAALLPPNGN